MARSHGSNFGKKVDGCPRCAELTAGAEPVAWTPEQAVDLRSHLASARHRSGGCGPVCTYGDW